MGFGDSHTVNYRELSWMIKDMEEITPTIRMEIGDVERTDLEKMELLLRMIG